MGEVKVVGASSVCVGFGFVVRDVGFFGGV